MAESYPRSYDQVASSLSMDDLRYVAAEVHSREARRNLQYDTPKVLWDAAATEQGDFFIDVLEEGRSVLSGLRIEDLR